MARTTVPLSASDLPPVCCVCGQAATHTRSETFTRPSPWSSWAFMFAGMPAITSALIPGPSYEHSIFSVAFGLIWMASLVFGRRSADLTLPVCARHVRRRRRGFVAFLLGLTLAVGLGVASGYASADLRTNLICAALLVGLGSVVAAIVLSDDRVRVADIEDRGVTLDRVSKEFAKAIESGARGPVRRAAVPAGGMDLATARYYRG